MCRKATAVLFLLLFTVSLVGCAAHIHKVGKGPQSHNQVQHRQWYVLWGLVPINTVDTHQMAGGAQDYEIKTEASALDILINIFTQQVSITSRTVTVTQ
jgi:hypothetical protein